MTTATHRAVVVVESAGTLVDTKQARRRMVSYASLADFSKDLDKVELAHRAGTLRKLGNREAGPIFGHLAVSMRGSFAGMPELKGAVPLWLRLLGPLVKKRALSGPLRPGVRMSGGAERALWDDGLTVETGLAGLRAEVARLSRADARPGAAHPIFGKLSAGEWKTFHLRHAELHMSFLQL